MKTTTVRKHTRKVKGRTTRVKQHKRKVDYEIRHKSGARPTIIRASSSYEALKEMNKIRRERYWNREFKKIQEGKRKKCLTYGKDFPLTTRKGIKSIRLTEKPRPKPKPQTLAIYEMKNLNERKGYHFFSPSSMKFFDSKIETKGQIKGEEAYFISSEQYHPSYRARYEEGIKSSPRKYTIRSINLTDGTTSEISKFQEYSSLSGAKSKLKQELK